MKKYNKIITKELNRMEENNHCQYSYAIVSNTK